MINMDKYLIPAMENYIQYFLSNLAYGNMEKIQRARGAVQIIKILDGYVADKRFLKHLDYTHVDKFYITVPAKFLVTGERIYQKRMKDVRYKLYTLAELNTRFGNTVDLFKDGKKIPNEDLKIALFDNCFVIELSKQYQHYSDMECIIRKHVYDKVFTSNTSINIPKDVFTYVEQGDFFLYVDGVQTNSYSIVDHGTYINIKTGIIGSRYEINYVMDLNYFGKTKTKNMHLDLRSFPTKYPISPSNIFVFNNGLFVNFQLTANTSNIFKTEFELTDQLDLYFVYNEYIHEDVQYTDNYEWFANYNSNFMDIVNNPSLLPEFMNSFSLFMKDISLQDFLANHYSDINVYHKDRIMDTITYSEELLNVFISFLYNEYKKDNNFAIDSLYIDLSTMDLKSLYRLNSNSDVIDPANYKTFADTMIVLKISNVENYDYNIYVDGYRYFDYYQIIKEGIDEYIYLRADKVTATSMIQIEKIKTNHDSIRTLAVVSTGNDKLIVTHASTVGLINNEHESKYITLAEQIGSQYIPSTLLKDSSYNSATDTLTITLTNSISSGRIFIINNCFYHKTYVYETKTTAKSYELILDGMFGSLDDISHIRVFKNGREIPRKYYTIEFPNTTNKYMNPKLIANIEYGVYEEIVVEYVPDLIKELYTAESLNTDGIIDLYNQTGIDSKYINTLVQYYTLNGRHINPDHFKFWCSKGMTIFKLNSTKFFSIMYIADKMFYQMIDTILSSYTNNPKLYDKYIMQLLHSSLKNDDNLTDDEIPCPNVNPERYGKVYYDLYNEFLRHNIIDDNKTMPEYIGIKYSDLIDKEKQTLIIDANEDMLSWMPLDANKIDDTNVQTILGLYYELLEDMASISVIDASEVPAEIYEKYKLLFDKNNTLVLNINK